MCLFLISHARFLSRHMLSQEWSRKRGQSEKEKRMLLLGEGDREGETKNIIIVLHFCLPIIVIHKLSPGAKRLRSTDNVPASLRPGWRLSNPQTE